jgi:cysteine desulfuration protein SufE
LIGPEHLSGGDAKQQGVTDVPGGAGHSDFKRSFHGAISHKHLVESKRFLPPSPMAGDFARNDSKQISGRFSNAMYPTKLNKIINLFESLPEDERRETLVSYAENAKRQEPREGENFDLVDVRKDEECTDTVGVYLHVDDEGKAHIRMTLGPEVQTLTRAMTAILCKGLDGSTPQEILDLHSDFVTRVVGTELVRLRSQTVYYVLTRIKSICKVWMDRQRMAAA